MRTGEKTRTKLGAWRRIRAALAICAVVVVATGATRAAAGGPPPNRPSSKCSEFSCEQ